MKTTKTMAIAMAGCMAASAECAGQALDEASLQARQMPGGAAFGARFFFDPGNTPFSSSGNNIVSYTFPLGRSGAFANLGAPDPYMHLPYGFVVPQGGPAGHWMEPDASASRVFTVGYAWRALKLEGAAYSGSGAARDERQPRAADAFGLDSTSTRLSYTPSPNWSFRFSRGTLSGLDQLAPQEDVRRVTVSATYKQRLADGEWHSTFAWGRSARKSSEPTMGYLLESALRFSGTHTVFGRLEQVGSGQLVSESGAAQNRTFKLNRFTVGYFHQVGMQGPVTLEAGAYVSRYAVPSPAASVYGEAPGSFTLFMRLNLR